MATKFLQKDLWKEITALAKKPGRRYVAVAYIGHGATRLLPLKRGDVLVTDLRLETVRAGQVNPFEIEKYMKRGVQVYSHANLHAKVYVLGKKAIIGSANLSNNSKQRLVETAVLVNDEPTVNSARGFVMQLTGEPVAESTVKSLKAAYEAPQFGDNIKANGQEAGFWIESVQFNDFDEKEEQLERKGNTRATQRIKSKRKHFTEPTSYPANKGIGKSAQRDDLVIHLVSGANGKIFVYPPSRILWIEKGANARGTEVAVIFNAAQREPQFVEWAAFKAKLVNHGIKRIGREMHRQINNLELRREILGLWADYEKR